MNTTTIAAVFNDTVTARQAMDDLIADGFPPDTMELSGNGVASSGLSPPDTDSLRDRFARLFGRDDTRAETYMTAIGRSNGVLTLRTGADELGRVTGILDRYGPLSIDDHPGDIVEGAWAGPDPSASSRMGEAAGARMARDTAMPPLMQPLAPPPDSGGSRMGLDEGWLWRTADFGESHNSGIGMITESQGFHMEEPPMTRLITPRRPAPPRAPVDPQTEASFREHHETTGEGHYEDAAPGYHYGAMMSRDQEYRGRDWDDVEPELQSRWESRDGHTTWSRIKHAVRHGWHRLTDHKSDHNDQR